MGPTINLLILNVILLLCTHNCSSVPNLNILTIVSALESLEYYDCSFFAKIVTFSLVFIEKKDTYNGETSGHRIT